MSKQVTAEETYLGDGVYAVVEDGYVVLMTRSSHGTNHVTKSIYLDTHVLKAFLDFIQKKLKDERGQWRTREEVAAKINEMRAVLKEKEESHRERVSKSKELCGRPAAEEKREIAKEATEIAVLRGQMAGLEWVLGRRN